MICSQCNKEFSPLGRRQIGRRQKYCSPECLKDAQKEQLKKHQQTDKYKEAVKKYRQSDKSKEAVKKYQQTDKYKEAVKKYQQSDKGKEVVKKHQQTDKYKEALKRYQQSEKGKKEGLEARKKYRQSDKGKAANKKVYEKRHSKGLISEYARKYEKERRKTDPIFKLTADVRHRLIIFLKASKMRKTNSTFKMVGCTPEFLKEYLEKQFKPGMTWQNHGVHGWHIDHTIPLASAKTPEAIEKLMHYSNLQPLWAIENIKKGDKY